MGLFGNAIGNVGNTLLGRLFEKHNDRRQLEQQGKLGQQQLGLNIQQMKAQKDADYDMWLKTGPQGMVDEIKKAGLSTGMMYSGSGAGGSAVGGGGGNVGAPQAPKGGGEIMGLQLMNAQKENIQADTEKKKVETEKTAGVDTDIAMEEKGIKFLERELKSEGYGYMLDKLGAEMLKAEAEAKKAGNMWSDEVMLKRGEVIAIGLANELKREGIKLTEAQTEAMLEGIKQKWAEVKVKEGKLELDKFVQDVANSTRLTVETAGKIVDTLMKGKMGANRAHWKNATDLEREVIKKQK